jgi:hypothetical protein
MDACQLTLESAVGAQYSSIPAQMFPQRQLHNENFYNQSIGKYLEMQALMPNKDLITKAE